jgi:vacuolar-type H+-ATPase subunit E/Vma4
MALEHLLDELTRRAETEIAAVRDAAAREAATLAGTAERLIAERRRATLDGRERTLRDDAERAVAAAARDARLAELEARDRLVTRVLARAAERLPAAAAGAVFRRQLPLRIAAARGCLGEGAGRLRCTPALADGCRRAAADHSELAVTADPAVPAGFVLESADGRVAIDGTLDGALARDRAALALVVMRAAEPPP